MPHQCVRCGTVYSNDSSKIMTGCECGSKLFFYRKKGTAESLKKEAGKFTKDDRKKIETEVSRALEGDSKGGVVFLDIESIKIVKPGKYEIDLESLFRKKPPVYGIDDGKYVVDIDTAFELSKGKKSKK